MTTVAAAILAFVCVAATSALAQTMYRCTLADGRTVYQDSKCEDEAKARLIKPPSGPSSAAPASGGDPCPKDFLPPYQVDPATGMESAAGRKARLEIEMTTEMHALYESCSVVPGFTAQFAAAFNDFRRKNPDAISRYESNPAAKGNAACRVRAEAQRARQNDKGLSQDKAAGCMQVIGPAMEKVAREGIPP